MSKGNKILVGCLALLLVLSVGYALFSETNKLMPEINKKGINLELKFAKDNIVLIDKKQITRVIENLLTNAIKFCGGKKI